jgi:peptidyl-tRNA hydrolase, PTH2 family
MLKENNKLNPKQVIIVRKDIEIPKGKFGAQLSHASTGAFLNQFIRENIEIDENNNDKIIYLKYKTNDENDIWLNERFTKIILEIHSLEELIEIYDKAKKKGMPVSLIEDAGFTIFKEPTITCLGIGPSNPELFIGLSDHLKLYK